jgi:hypothetical protein
LTTELACSQCGGTLTTYSGGTFAAGDTKGGWLCLKCTVAQPTDKDAWLKRLAEKAQHGG